MTTGEVIGTGRSADVYDIGDGRVLRRYRDRRPAARVVTEARVMEHAREAGVPVPEVFDVSGSEIVMERVTGPTMLAALARRPWTAGAQARLLASLHRLVHRIPASGPAALGVPPLSFRLGGPRDTDVLLHRDLHPGNVILGATGPVIIDWESCAYGPAAADIAMTWAIIGFSTLNGPRSQAFAALGAQSLFARSFMREAEPIDEDTRATAVHDRLSDPHLLPAEAARLAKLIPRPRTAADG